MHLYILFHELPLSWGSLSLLKTPIITLIFHINDMLHMNLVNEIHYYMIKRSERFSPKKKKKKTHTHKGEKISYFW